MGETLRIELRWPDKDLSPNARPHHMKLHRVKKAASEAAYWATKIALGHRRFRHDGKSDILLRQIAHAPDKRDRDRDNLDHSLKAARDGIAMALDVNDKHFRPTGVEWGDPVRGGLVVIEVEIPSPEPSAIAA